MASFLCKFRSNSFELFFAIPIAIGSPLPIANWFTWLFFAYCLLPTAYCFSQHFTRTDSIPVKINGKTLKFPWHGGHDYCQFSEMDVNQDGIKDLFVFDRTGNRISIYINKGIQNTTDYLDSTSKYAPPFPELNSWALLFDYNCDGKEDIFTTATYPDPSSIRVYKNTSTPGNIQFALVKSYLKDQSNLFIPANPIGLPAIVDMDNDGDLDIVTFNSGSFVTSYYINKSKELGYNCDSLIFSLAPGCWGHFQEGGTGSCSVALSACKIATGDTATGDTAVQATAPTDPTIQNNGSSCMLCLDIDGDGDKDLLLGQGPSCCNLDLLTNGGTPASASITSFTANFPAGGPYVNLRYNPCGYFVDVNNDAKRDLLVAPNAQNISLSNESIWEYLNVGADNSPVFHRTTRSFLQEDMIDVGQGADPAFFDFDNDGLTDLLVSNYVLTRDSCPGSFAYGVYAFKNTGTATAPAFTLVNTDYANLSSQLPNITNKHLTFGDVDGDGDEDLFVGDYDGYIHYFQNTAAPGQPANFSLTNPINYKDAAGDSIDIGSNATPQLVDVDNDGKLDLLIGKRSGSVAYYRNIGTAFAPSFQLAASTFGGVDVYSSGFTGYSVPLLYSFAGMHRLLVGSESSRMSGSKTGWIWQYDNIDGNLGGTFNRVDSMFQQIWEGPYMTLSGQDINNDGRMDLAIGNYCGGVAIYLGDSSTVGMAELHSQPFDFDIYPNPSNGIFNLKITLPIAIGIENLKMPRLDIYNVYGEEIMSDTHFQIGQFSNFQISVPNGIYYCTISSEGFSRTKKLVVVR